MSDRSSNVRLLMIIIGYWIDASGLSNTFIAIGVLSLFFQLLTAPMLYFGKTFRRMTAKKYRNYIYIRDGR